MDELDRKILDILEENARMPFVEIGKKLGVSEATIRNRVKNLVSSGQITKFTILTETRRGMKAIILVTVAPKVAVNKVARKIKEIKNVKEVYEISGECDIVCVVGADSTKETNETVDAIRNTLGVLKTVTNMVLK